MIYLIWAMTKDGIIAKNGSLPWKIKEEMKYFRTTTLNKTVVMGSKTLDSMHGPLKNRQNIVLTRNFNKYKENNYENCVFTDNVKQLINKYFNNENEDIWVIGGAKIYQEFLPYANYLYVSIIKNDYPGDLKFPEVNWNEFEKVSETEHDEFIADIWKRKK